MQNLTRMFICFILLLAGFQKSVQANFDRHFYDKGLRIDFMTTGQHNHAIYTLQKFVEDPIWSSSKEQLIDKQNFGVHQIRILDTLGNVLFSKGFSSLFQEWQSTNKAKSEYQTFTLSVVVPYPKEPVIIELYDRSKVNVEWLHQWTYKFSKTTLVSTERQHQFSVREVVTHGHHNQKLDILFIAEGYQLEELPNFNATVDTLVHYLFSHSPFKERKTDINIRALQSFSKESGSDDPLSNIYRQTVVNSTFNTLEIDRYVMCPDHTAVMKLTWGVPCDLVYILVNTPKYGGGGIYNFYGISSASIPKVKEVFVHELGHTLSALADEYYTSLVSYESLYKFDIEPWEANITTRVEFGTKWENLIAKNTPTPTPDDAEYDNVVGLFEGGGYVSKGIFRPMRNCRMKSTATDKFCVICNNTIDSTIDTYVK